MHRYIDADWITQKLEWWQDQLATNYGQNDEYVLCLAEVLMKLDDTPTADVMEVVRCKECKNHEWCSIEDMALNDETFFCKWGERREDNG